MKVKSNKIRIFFASLLICTLIIGIFAKNVYDDMNLGLDLQGGFEIVYDVTALDGSAIDEDDMPAVVSSISKRIDILGISEPDISIESGNRVRVQLAGVTNIDEARNMISTTANLTFRDSKDNELMDATVLVEGGAVVASQNGRPVVQLKIKDTDKFYDVTKSIAATNDKLMVIWLDYAKGDSYKAEQEKEDPKFISAATVQQGLNDSTVIISGSFDTTYAQNLAKLINAGSLPVTMTEVYSNVVSAEFGENAFNSTMFAGSIGILIVMLMMIVLYGLPGVISAISIAIYIFVVLTLYNLMGGIFTLSGIAALVLGVGMAVDSSIITFERIKESLYCGRSVKTAFIEGNEKSFSTIFDAQLTTFISALILFIFGTGSVKGFATMLIVSTLVTFVVIVGVVRFLLGLLVKSNYLDDKKHWFKVKENQIPDLDKKQERFYFDKFSKFDFVGKAKYFIGVSATIMIVAVAFMGFNALKGNSALNLGIDFASGTRITITSDSTIYESDINKIFEECGLKPNEIKFSGQDNKIATVALTQALDKKSLDKVKNEIKEKYKYEANDAIVTPIVGKELVKNAFIISILAWVAIMIYISIRFKWDFALAGIVALFHDVFIVIAFFAIAYLEINTEFIAVLLAIIGYSINDSIVAFDRIRENINNKEKYSDQKLIDITNKSLGDICRRSLIASITTIIPVVCLLVLGSSSIFNFNIALIIGLIAGASSSLFIAAQFWLYMRIKDKNRDKKVKVKKVKKSSEIDELVIIGIND